MKTRPIPQKLEPFIQSELQPEERIVWSSSPSPGRFVRKTLPPFVLFGMFPFFFAVSIGGFKTLDFRYGFGAFLVALLFFLPGFIMFSAPYWAAKKARSSAYVITTERVIIFELQAFGGICIRSFFPQQLSVSRRVQRDDGSGDLILDKKTSNARNELRATSDIGFLGISDVQAVESMILTLIKSASK